MSVSEGAGGSEKSLAFVVSDDAPESGEKSIFGRKGGVSVRQISVATLKQSLETSVEGLREVLTDIARSPDGLRLKEAQVQFEVSASGGVTFVGTSQVSSRSAIVLTFEA